MKKNIVLFVIVLLLLVASIAYYVVRSSAPKGSDSTSVTLDETQRRDITTVVSDLDTPWSITRLTDDRLLVSEREGTIRIVGDNGREFTVGDVVERGEGGLLGLTLDPDFETNNFIYVYKTTTDSNVVERYTLSSDQLSGATDIITGVPFSAVHNGGEIKFGPDKKLYITTGDAGTESNAQAIDNLAGKILRLNADGTVPSDNPFKNAVWSYGHRNPQGLAWDDRDRLWSTEHGPSGLESGYDELNLIKKGGNYGWPTIRGDQTGEGLTSPVAQSGGKETWAPGGLAYDDGALYFTGLRGATLYKAVIYDESVSLSKYLTNEYGRLRSIYADGDSLLIGTSNRDGRGSPKTGDDKIIRVPLALIK